ncbi:hypothetical protein ACRALDRAFT_2016511 [Sodiomyces alcalophilus JCM 7366]|uniref:uncharacterized protein n=1 Tax=Sodiomyces alcalophilus JCM 7366 TaxID=591952 RepID=UPI0039B49BDA
MKWQNRSVRQIVPQVRSVQDDMRRPRDANHFQTGQRRVEPSQQPTGEDRDERGVSSGPIRWTGVGEGVGGALTGRDGMERGEKPGFNAGRMQVTFQMATWQLRVGGGRAECSAGSRELRGKRRGEGNEWMGAERSGDEDGREGNASSGLISNVKVASSSSLFELVCSGSGSVVLVLQRLLQASSRIRCCLPFAVTVAVDRSFRAVPCTAPPFNASPIGERYPLFDLLRCSIQMLRKDHYTWMMGFCSRY